MKVAWHEVPGIRFRIPSRRVRYDRYAQLWFAGETNPVGLTGSSHTRVACSARSS
jgi:hypothetical protein